MDSIRTFEQHRPRLYGIAYRMLGVRAEAEDVLQDAYLRWKDVDVAALQSTEAWLTTTVTRLCIDRLRRLKTEREAYFGPWLPEPLAEHDLRTPELAAELSDNVSIAFLALLEALSPEERAAFVLHDVLDDDYADIAEALGKTEPACRQLVHRARERVTSKRRRFQVDDATRRQMLERFVAIVNRGDRKEIVSLFTTDAVLTSDGGGKAAAVFRPLLGAERISYLYYVITRRTQGASAANMKYEARIVALNGELGLAYYLDDKLISLIAIETDGSAIQSMYVIRNPDKLRAFADGRVLDDPAIIAAIARSSAPRPVTD